MHDVKFDFVQGPKALMVNRSLRAKCVNIFNFMYYNDFNIYVDLFTLNGRFPHVLVRQDKGLVYKLYFLIFI